MGSADLCTSGWMMGGWGGAAGGGRSAAGRCETGCPCRSAPHAPTPILAARSTGPGLLRDDGVAGSTARLDAIRTACWFVVVWRTKTLVTAMRWTGQSRVFLSPGEAARASRARRGTLGIPGSCAMGGRCSRWMPARPKIPVHAAAGRGVAVRGYAGARGTVGPADDAAILAHARAIDALAGRGTGSAGTVRPCVRGAERRACDGLPALRGAAFPADGPGGDHAGA